MKINADNKYELIDKYVSGVMDENEALEFSNIVASNDELSAEVNLVKELQELQDFTIQENNLKQTLHSFKKPEVNVNKYLKSAIVLAVLGLLMMLFIKNFNSTKSAVINSAPIAMIEPLELATKAEESFENLRTMEELYNAQNYKSALPYLDKYLADKPEDLDVLLAKGISLMELDKFGEAQQEFEKIKSLNPRVKKYKWYLAINYMRQGKVAQSQEILKDIVANESYNAPAARKLLNK